MLFSSLFQPHIWCTVIQDQVKKIILEVLEKRSCGFFPRVLSHFLMSLSSLINKKYASVRAYDVFDLILYT